MLILSSLPHTWILDVDGTIVKHNGYKIDGYDTLLSGVREFWNSISKNDQIILLTARKGQDIELLKNFLAQNKLWYTHLIPNCPVGERILVNDNKPSGLQCSYAMNKERDAELKIQFTYDDSL